MVSLEKLGENEIGESAEFRMVKLERVASLSPPLFTVTVYVLLVVPSSAVTTTLITLSPSLRFPVKGVVPSAPKY